MAPRAAATSLQSNGTSIWVDCGNGTFGHLQEHIAVEDLSAVVLTHGHPDHCVDIYGLHVLPALRPRHRAPAGLRARGAREVPALAGVRLGQHLRLVSSWATTTPPRSATSTCASAAPTTRRPRYAVEATHDGRRMIYTADTGPEWTVGAFAPGADLVLSEATYLHDNIPAPIHLSAKQAGEAAREAARPAAHPHPPLADDRPDRGDRGGLGGLRQRCHPGHPGPRHYHLTPACSTAKPHHPGRSSGNPT